MANVIFPETTRNGFVDSGAGFYISQVFSTELYDAVSKWVPQIEAGKKFPCRVEWDGTIYETNCVCRYIGEHSGVPEYGFDFGNLYAVGLGGEVDTGEPFVILVENSYSGCLFVAFSDADTHTFAIYDVAQEEDAEPAEPITYADFAFSPKFGFFPVKGVAGWKLAQKLFGGKPTKYTPVLYIESDGNQYIDTGVPINEAPVEYDFKYALANTTQHDKYVTGFKAGNLVASFGIYNGAIYTAYGKDNSTYHATIPADTEPHTIQVNASGTYVDGVYMKPTDYTLPVSGDTGNHYIFQRYHSNLLQRGAFRVYYFKLFLTDGTLIRDFVPCKNASGEYGLWERVEDKFYGNMGTGNFTAPLTFDDMSLVDYIESDGYQYINTGFYPNQDTRVVCDFEPLSYRAKTNGCIFGSRKSAVRQEFSLFGAVTGGVITNGFADLYATSNIAWIDKYPNTGRYIADKNKNNTYINGDLVASWNYVNFTTESPLYLMALCQAGAWDYQSCAMRLYSCKVYDNDVLIRDFVPCRNPSDAYGLWDKVESKFYGLSTANAATGYSLRGEEYDYSEEYNYSEEHDGPEEYSHSEEPESV